MKSLKLYKFLAKKFFENKSIRNTIIYTSITFSILSASLPTRAEDVASEFLKTSKAIEKAEEKRSIVETFGNEEIKLDQLLKHFSSSSVSSSPNHE